MTGEDRSESNRTEPNQTELGYRGVPDRGPPRERRQTVTGRVHGPESRDSTGQDKTRQDTRPEPTGEGWPNRAEPSQTELKTELVYQ